MLRACRLERKMRADAGGMARVGAFTRAVAVVAGLLVVVIPAQLAGATAQASFMRRDLATTTSDPATGDPTASGLDSTTTEDTSLCPEEYGACLADAACLECAGFIEAAYEGCRDPDYSGLTATCSEKLEAGCCQLEGSVGCVDNPLLAAVYGG